MDVTKNTERAGVDIRVALSSKAKMLSASGRGRSSPAVDAASGPSLQDTSPHDSSFRATVKRHLRPVAHAIFGIFKPVARPIAFRLRAYLVMDLRREAHERHERLSQELETHMQAQLRSVERLLVTNSTQLLREIQAVRESLQRNLPDASPNAARRRTSADQLQRFENSRSVDAHRTAVTCAPDEVLLRTKIGPVLCASSDSVLVSALLRNGEFEPGTRRLIQKLMNPGDTFVDVGANIGLHAMAAAMSMRGKGRIVAFEPFLATHALLEKNVWLNGYSGIVKTHPTAVSNRQGTAALYLGRTSGHHSLYPLQDGMASVLPSVEVPLARIDDLLSKATDTVDLIKIQVEGAELDVLAGARATIVRNPDIALIVEFVRDHLRRTGHSTADWLRHFEQLGFGFHAIDAETGVLRDCSALALESDLSVNLFFARPGSPALTRARGAT